MNDRFLKTIKYLVSIMACLFACLFAVSFDSYASDNMSDYKQIIYDQDDGLGSSEIKSIIQTKSGYIWIGTDAGLYRFNGNEFLLYKLWDLEKEDVYSINSLFQDSQDRLWVATYNYGLFCIDKGNTIHFTDDYYNGVKCINDICEDENGVIYVATAYGIYTVDKDMSHLKRFDGIKNYNIQNITYTNGKVWGIYGGNIIFYIDLKGNVKEYNSSKYTENELSTISSSEDGRVFIGTIGNDILTFKKIKKIHTYISSYNGINSIIPCDDRLYICSDNGVGYFSKSNFVNIGRLGIDTYIKDMIIDYEGNFWFASTKFGLLNLQKSKFNHFNREKGISENISNAFYMYQGNSYIGTDEGLIILDSSGKQIQNDLTKYLDNVSIRDICSDFSGNLWISTYRRFGVVRYSKEGKLSNINKGKGLISNLVNGLYILRNGNIAVYTEEGISLMDNTGSVYESYGYSDGLDSPSIISLYQNKDGVLYAGSDGGGLYTIDKNKNIKHYTENDGLASNVVTCFAEGKSGLWIGTNNGLSYFDETFRAVSNIDFSNSIASILVRNDYMYIIGSKGLIYATEDELLGTEPLSERYFSSGDGIESALNLYSKNYIDENGLIYICTNSGIITYDTQNNYINYTPPKLTVSEVDVDGEIYYYNELGGAITIPSDVQKVTISFAVLSFTNRENIQIKYQLEGFDTEEELMSGNDNLEVSYTNLDGGTYVFHVSASNGDGIENGEPLRFFIVKQLGFFERKIVRYTIVIIVIVLIFMILLGLYILQKRFIGKNRELEDLTKEHEDIIKSSTAKTDYLANMSNEIKLPVNAMISKANSMLKDANIDDETQDDLKVIIEKGHDVLERVDETIHLARLESGSEEVVSEPYSITTLICDISDGMLNKLNELPIKFLVDLGKNIPDILIGDFDKIKNVLEIILDNAIKYTKEGSITLSVDCYDFSSDKDDHNINLVFSISDTGTGIPEDRLEHIFEIYYTDESKKSVVNIGNGVSLSIAKKLTDIMHGELEVESTYGAGTTFTFSVEQLKPDADGKSIPLNENTMDRVSREEAERMWAPDLRILLVDDVEISRNVALDVITRMEIQCDTASDGPEAIDMVINNDYDMVLMDIVMPVMNGIDTLKEIRDLSDEKYQKLIVVGMSEDALGKNRQDIINEGFSDVILKPFDITVLAGTITRFVDPEKIKYKTNDVAQYVSDSSYTEGLKKLEDFIDITAVLDKIGGSIDVYNRILQSFYNQNKDAIVDLKQKMNYDYRGFRNKIHNIRTGCQNIGAVEAAEIVLRLENAINLGNKSYVKDNINLVYDCLTVLTSSIEDYLEFVEAVKNKDEEAESVEETSSVQDNYDPNMDSAFIVESEEEAEAQKAAESSNFSDNDVSDSSDNMSEEDGSEDGSEDDSDYEDDDSFDDDSQNDIKIIDINALTEMRQATYDEDIEKIKVIYNDICDEEYGSEDLDFLSVLRENIMKEDLVEINELLTTYISLKSSL